MQIDFYTSVNNGYLPKARTLATSVKAHHPDARFHLLLSDDVPAHLRERPGPFDTIITPSDLGDLASPGWVFKHSVVELCTAVKGAGARHILDHHAPDYLFYLDPDMALFETLTPLVGVGDSSIHLTPHLTCPERTHEGILDNELSALRHGVYNLGFLGVRNSPDGREFVDWWADRLARFCFADIPNGIFTDQKWVDLAPGFFPFVNIIHDPGYNVATWNISTRDVQYDPKDQRYMVNGKPLRVYHFSGWDSGAQLAMLNKYGNSNPALYRLRDWYIAQLQAHEKALGSAPSWSFGVFSNGAPITSAHRTLYRTRDDLQQAFPDPFATEDVNQSYYHWFEANADECWHEEPESVDALKARLAEAERELAVLKGSRRWRYASRIVNMLRLRAG